MQVSNETADALVNSIGRALRKVHDGHVNMGLLLLLIETLGQLTTEVISGRILDVALKDIDIFTPILKCQSLQNNLDIAAILVAFCSVHEDLQPLITGSITKWSTFLPSGDSRALDFRPGFYTIVSQFGKEEDVREIVARVAKYNLRDTLVKLWIPNWLFFIGKSHSISELKSLVLDPGLVLFEDKLDFHIATMNSATIQSKKAMAVLTTPSYSFLFYKISQRAVLFPRWINKSLYQMFSIYLFHSDSQDTNINDLNFHLEVLMEIVDHPDMNYFEEPKLVTILYLSLNKLYDVPCNKLHLTLGTLGSTQSLPALVNMVEYLLCKFLLDFGNTCDLVKSTQIDTQLFKENNQNWYKSKKHITKLPSWFQTSIMPYIPPISKSLFVYDQTEWLKHESTNIIQVFDLLLDCLCLILLINAKFLREYRQIDIDPMTFNTAGIEVNDVTSRIEFLVKEEYMKLYLIPLFSCLALSKQVLSGVTKIYEEKKYQMKNEILSSSIVNLSKQLVRTYGNFGVYHLISFATRISAEDLVMQSMAIKILNILLFNDEENFAINVIQKNPITLEALRIFINDWNDESAKYKAFYEMLFNTHQPKVKTNAKTLSSLIELLPNHEVMLQKIALEHAQKKAQRPSDSIQLQKVHVRPTVHMHGNKFNPYSAASFVPASKTTALSQGEMHSFDEQPSPQTLRKSSSVPWANLNNDDSKIPSNQERQAILRPPMKYSTYPQDSSYVEQTQHSFAFNNISSIISTPKTPNMSTSTVFSSPWEESPSMQSTPNVSKVVNTGKNYILGGHNRIKNNSRAQSIHIDDFEPT